MKKLVRVIKFASAASLALFGLGSGLYAFWVLIGVTISRWGVLPKTFGPFSPDNLPPLGFVVWITIASCAIAGACWLYLKIDDKTKE